MRNLAKILLLVCTVFIYEAHGQWYFGRNKIQYNAFDWHILQTDHFEIYYYPEMRDLAEIGAAHAEKVYKLLESKFNHNLNRRVPLIFYATHAHFQESNTIPYFIPEGIGGFFEFLKGRVVVPANGSISDFKRVLQHELVHVFSHSVINRVLRDHKMQNHPGAPLWFIEGIAEYWSAGWDSQAEMFIRDAVLSDWLVPLPRIYEIYGSFLMYKEGQNILKHIADNYGDEKLRQLHENIWMSREFSEVLKATIGKDFKELNEEWTYALKKDHYPLLQEYDSVNMVTRKVTQKGFNIKPTYYRLNDRDYTVFISNRTGYSNIYMMPLTDEKHEPKPEILIAGERTSEFESFHLLSSNIDINAAGELAFASRSGERDILYLFDLEHREITEHHGFDHLVSLFSPSWAPDGNRIVFTGLAFSGKSDLYIYDRERKALNRLTDDFFDDIDPAWSPDGRFIAFSSDRGQNGSDGCYDIFNYDTETGLINYITQSPFNDKLPAWSRDGKSLAFTSDRSGTSNIWIISPIQSFTGRYLASADKATFLSPNTDLFADRSFPQQKPVLKQVTFFTTGAFDPEWTPDGDLLFTSFENLKFQINMLEDVVQKFTLSESVTENDIKPDGLQWSFDRLQGEGGVDGIKYKPRYSLDIAQSQIALDPIFGTSGGMQLAISDMLGNKQWYFLLYNTARTRDEFLESFNFAVSRTDLSRRTNFSLGMYHLAGRFYNRYDQWFWERRFGGFGALSYPLSKFERIEASLNIRSSDKEWFFTNYRRDALLISNFVSFIKDNSLWGYTGPIDGMRLNITLGNTIDVANANVNFVTAIVDYRRYLRLSPKVTHAVRLLTQINKGKESTPFFMGGSWDLRGYRFWSIWGTKLFLLSNELRFPFIDSFVLHFPFGGLGINAIRGALFTDIGDAWDEKFDSLRGSAGFGIRFRFGGMLVLRFDVGRKFETRNPNKFYRYGEYEIDDDWFTQFFFGYDF